MKIVIIGSGISGLIMYRLISSLNPKIYDAKKIKTALQNHQTLLRIRDPELSSILGCDLKEIKVDKNIYYRFDITNKCNIKINNLYSLKVCGELNNKSIQNTDTCKRYLIENFNLIEQKINSSYELFNIKDKELFFRTDKGIKKVKYDYCISTIPLPILLNIINYKIESKFEHKAIYTLKCKLNIKSNVYQTIYIPEFRYPVYRASLHGDTLIMESLLPINDKCKEFCLDLFGLNNNFLKQEKEYYSEFGKLISIDDEERLATICMLTNEYNIFSLGRFAIWKSIRIDNVIKDAKQIKKMILSRNKYFFNKLAGEIK